MDLVYISIFAGIFTTDKNWKIPEYPEFTHKHCHLHLGRIRDRHVRLKLVRHRKMRVWRHGSSFIWNLKALMSDFGNKMMLYRVWGEEKEGMCRSANPWAHKDVLDVRMSKVCHSTHAWDRFIELLERALRHEFDTLGGKYTVKRVSINIRNTDVLKQNRWESNKQADFNAHKTLVHLAS